METPEHGAVISRLLLGATRANALEDWVGHTSELSYSEGEEGPTSPHSGLSRAGGSSRSINFPHRLSLLLARGSPQEGNCADREASSPCGSGGRRGMAPGGWSTQESEGDA